MRSTIATIDLDALRNNLRVIRKKSNNARILGMVKANAYGHGMVRVSQTLEEAGIDVLGVAFASEGVRLRKEDVSCPIMILTPTEPEEARSVVDNNLSAVVCSVAQGQGLSKEAVKQGKVVELHLYVDTGMHRDGIQPADVFSVVEKLDLLPNVHVVGICTHFATADEAGHPFITEQLNIFNRVLEACESVGRKFAHVHAANTGAIWQMPGAHFNLVRPGLSLYGYASPADISGGLQRVMSVTSKVGAVRRISAGESVSYGRRYVAKTDTSIVTLPIGYGDGYMRSLTGKAQCLIRGKFYPIVGVICMDECMVDVGNDDVAVGDQAVLMGSQKDANGTVKTIDATDLATLVGTIPYEITTAISARVPRVYK